MRVLRMSVRYERLAHPALICLPRRVGIRPRKPEYDAGTLGDAHQAEAILASLCNSFEKL